MGNLLEYSGIVTKTRAMEAKLLKPEQFQEIAVLHNVPEVVEYLKRNSSYAYVLNQLNPDQIHRGNIEKVLTQSLYHDYTKLYRFCGQKQRRFMQLRLKSYEISLIDYCFRIVINHYKQPFDLAYKKNFFDKYSQLSIDRLITSRTTDELIENLKGTEYYEPLKKLKDSREVTLFDYDLTLDLYYFTTLWNTRKKLLKKEDLELYQRDCGSQIDLLNMMWIYRAKKYYQMSEASTYTLLIPVTYKLHDGDIRAMVAAADERALEEAIQKTYYGKRFMKLDSQELETVYDRFLRKVYTEEKRQNPYSLAAITGYLYDKEQELDKLTTVLEGVRYGLPASETLKYIEQSKDAGNQ